MADSTRVPVVGDRVNYYTKGGPYVARVVQVHGDGPKATLTLHYKNGIETSAGYGPGQSGGWGWLVEETEPEARPSKMAEDASNRPTRIISPAPKEESK